MTIASDDVELQGGDVVCPNCSEQKAVWVEGGGEGEPPSHPPKNTEYSCSKTHVHKITNVPVFYMPLGF